MQSSCCCGLKKKMIDVSKNHLLTIKSILQKHAPGAEVRAFGSRVAGTAKRYSDLDLVIVGKNEVAASVLEKIKEDFQESDVPFRIDILDWHKISKEFRDIIGREYEIL